MGVLADGAVCAGAYRAVLGESAKRRHVADNLAPFRLAHGAATDTGATRLERGTTATGDAVPRVNDSHVRSTTETPGSDWHTRAVGPRWTQDPAIGERRRHFEEHAFPHAAALYRVAYHLTCSTREAEALTEAAYVRAFHAFAGTQGDDLRIQMLAALHRTYLETCRQGGVGTSPDHDLDGLPSCSVTPTPMMRAGSGANQEPRSSSADAIARAFAALPAAWRLVLLLADVEELTHPQIAAVTGVPVDVVLTRLRRARECMRHALPTSVPE